MLKEKRKELGLSQEEVGKAVGVSAGTISRWETGDIKNMRRDKIYKLAKVLGVKPMDIVEMPEDPVEIQGVCNMNKQCKKHLMEKILLLDETDRLRIEERIDTLLESEKYERKRKKKRMA